MPDELDDPLCRLHDRVVLGERLALEELAGALLDLLPRSLARWPMRADPDQAVVAVADAIIEYAARPALFDPSRGVPLAQYIRLIARRNLLDALRSEQRRTARERRYAMEMSLVSPPLEFSDSADVERLYGAARAICSDREFEAFRAWLGGEHKVARLTAALGLSQLPLVEQRRAVKRFRERTVRRLLRYLTRP